MFIVENFENTEKYEKERNNSWNHLHKNNFCWYFDAQLIIE